MDAVVQMIKQKRVTERPFLHHLTLRTMGELTESEGCAALHTRFASEMEANDFLTDKVN